MNKLSAQEKLAAFREANAAAYAVEAAKPTPVPCKRCGKPLKRKESIDRGYGPECAYVVANESIDNDWEKE